MYPPEARISTGCWGHNSQKTQVFPALIRFTFWCKCKANPQNSCNYSWGKYLPKTSQKIKVSKNVVSATPYFKCIQSHSSSSWFLLLISFFYRAWGSRCSHSSTLIKGKQTPLSWAELSVLSHNSPGTLILAAYIDCQIQRMRKPLC